MTKPRFPLIVPSSSHYSNRLGASKPNPTTPVPAVPVSRAQAIALATAVRMRRQLSDALWELATTSEVLGSRGLDLDKLAEIERLLAHMELNLAQARAALDRLEVRKAQLQRMIEIRSRT
jgi:hypothetical protein